MKKLIAIWQLTRLEHGLMFGIAVLIGGVIGGRIDANVFMAVMVAIFMEIAIFSLNDYFDMEIDRKNKRMDRPLVRGDVSPSLALLLYAIFLPLAISISYFINIACFSIAIIIAILSTLYDMWLKKWKIAGNIYIAFTMAIPFVFGAYASAREAKIVYIISSIAFLAGVGREIMKDIMDFEGDVLKGVKSIPFYIGKEKSAKISAILYFMASIIALIPFFYNLEPSYHGNFIYLFLVIMADAILIYISIKILRKIDRETLKKCRKLSIIALFIGLLAFLCPLA